MGLALGGNTGRTGLRLGVLLGTRSRLDGLCDVENAGSVGRAYDDGSSCSSEGMYMRKDNGIDGDGAYASAPEAFSHEGGATYSRGGCGTSS